MTFERIVGASLEVNKTAERGEKILSSKCIREDKENDD